jgi:ABC-type xylose transport system permease subunit
MTQFCFSLKSPKRKIDAFSYRRICILIIVQCVCIRKLRGLLLINFLIEIVVAVMNFQKKKSFGKYINMFLINNSSETDCMPQFL